MDTRNRTWTNGAIGAVVTFVVFFVPAVGILAPVLGGGVSGFLEEDGMGGGAVAGVVMAVLSGIPALLLGLAGLFLGAIPLLGDSAIANAVGGVGAIGGLFVLLLWFLWTAYALLLGAFGGAVGGAVAER